MAICEDFLCSTLNIENATDLLIFADIHSATQLKSAASNYIKHNINEIVNTRGWKTMKSNQTHLLLDFLPKKDAQQ
ncbi:speckle-type POZ protein-like protein [Leptotrombidium deliense]|uniref:Speckle-type POZ protein-like protein n=1 Tax=Leptotrombidium deliense TaxID=299467 RepID=A0A443SCS9_9ACAR|nr:speckle-type POZ protein-like protein [Leptotrombidium deliense]